MVHCILGTPHTHAANATEDHISGGIPRIRDGAGGFTSWRNRDWHEPDPIAVGEPYYPTVGY